MGGFVYGPRTEGPAATHDHHRNRECAGGVSAWGHGDRVPGHTETRGTGGRAPVGSTTTQREACYAASAGLDGREAQSGRAELPV